MLVSDRCNYTVSSCDSNNEALQPKLTPRRKKKQMLTERCSKVKLQDLKKDFKFAEQAKQDTVSLTLLRKRLGDNAHRRTGD